MDLDNFGSRVRLKRKEEGELEKKWVFEKNEKLKEKMKKLNEKNRKNAKNGKKRAIIEKIGKKMNNFTFIAVL